MSASLVSDGSKGSVSLQLDGGFTYTPQQNASGIDTFTYQVGDGIGLSESAVVTINLTPVNDAPDGQTDTFAGAPDEDLSIDAPRGIGQRY